MGSWLVFNAKSSYDVRTKIIGEHHIAAPSSTKNSKGERDPEMHQTKKGNQWHFGMKAHIGVDADSGLVHTVIGTAANVNDVTQASGLLQEQVQRLNASIRAKVEHPFRIIKQQFGYAKVRYRGVENEQSASYCVE